MDIKKKFFKTGFVSISNSNLSIEKLSKIFNGNLKTDKHHIKNNPEIQIVSDTELFKNDSVPWHTDWSYGPGDYDGTMLQCIEDQTNTPITFVDMNLIYNKAKEKFGEEVEFLREINGYYSPPNNLEYCFDKKVFKYLKKNPKSKPILFDHPINKNSILYFSPSTLVKTDKLFEKDKYIEMLDEYSINYYWKPDDIIIWDNLRFLHKRESFSGKRILHRIQFKYV